MVFRFVFILIFLVSQFGFSQDKNQRFKLGLSYGYGKEIKNSDYTYSNEYVKIPFFWKIKNAKNFELELLLQPEINFAQHQLLNLYFVKISEPNFEIKREEFTKLKNINEYILSVGIAIRHSFSNQISGYAILSVGPMYTDTETERLSKGFAFCDVLSIGISYQIGSYLLDFRPNVRHTSNAGLQSSNAGFNTLNLDFGILYSF